MTERRPVLPDELAHVINVALRVVETRHRRSYAAKLPHERDEGADRITEHLMERLRSYEITTVINRPERGV